MPIMNKLPVGGGGSAEPGIRDGQGIVKLNIFTQSTEPTTKDGIWIKTNNKYQKVMINQKYANESGIWSNDLGPLPYQFGSGFAVIYNNEIHIMGGVRAEYTKYHYKYNGSTWSSVSTLPYEFSGGYAVVYNGEIHILGGIHDNEAHYKYNGSTWYRDVSAPRSISRNIGNMAALYNNEIHIFCYNAGTIDHYKYDGSSWTKASTFPYTDYNINYVYPIAYNNSEIHVFILNRDSITSSHYKFKSSTKSYNDNTVIIYRGNNTNNGAYLTSMANMSVIEGHGSNNRFISGFDDVLYFASSAFNWNAPMYYGNGTQWIKFKN